MNLLFFIVNSNISNKLRKHWSNNGYSLWSVHILHEIPLTSILNTISSEKLSFMIILNLKRILFENVDNFLNGQGFIVIFKNTFKQSLFTYSFKCKEIIQISRDMSNLFKGDSFDPFLFLNYDLRLNFSLCFLMLGFHFFFILNFHILKSLLQFWDISCLFIFYDAVLLFNFLKFFKLIVSRLNKLV